MQLQACDKCGAQFDVAAFAKGQQFSCGACGQVLTAHAASARAGRVPGSAGGSGTPAPAAAAPSRKPGGAGKRGAQYTPPQRESSAASSERPSRRTAPGREPKARRAGGTRGSGGAQGAGGPNKGLIIGGIGLVVLIVLGLVVFGGGEDASNTQGGNNTASNAAETQAPVPVAPTETAAQVLAEYLGNKPTMARHFKAFIDRLKVIDDVAAKEALKTVYRDYVDGPGSDDVEARKALGYKHFSYEIPGDLSFRDFPYMRAVEAASQREWFSPDEDDAYQIALEAQKQTEDHYQKMIDDRSFRAGVQARALLAQDQYFREYNYATRWAEPYLICYASAQERMSKFDLLSIADPAERRRKMDELEQRRKQFESVLDEKAKIFTQLYKYFLDRYGERLNLKHLMEEYGGRPDYPVGVRTMADGLPLIVWIFDSKESFNEFHTKIKQEPIPHNVAGYFSPQTGYVYLYDEGTNPDNRVFEINKNVHEGVHQLEYWFTRQRNKWRKPPPGQDFFGEGIAEYTGSVQMGDDQTLKFIGVNVPRLKSMQRNRQELEARGSSYRIFPIERLTGFTTYGEVQGWGAQEWKLHPDFVLGTFYEQSWAFVYFLNEYKNGAYKDRFLTFFDLVLHAETGISKGSQAFREAFRIRDDEDWEDLDREFQKFVSEDLMKRNPAQYDYRPPTRQ